MSIERETQIITFEIETATDHVVYKKYRITLSTDSFIDFIDEAYERLYGEYGRELESDDWTILGYDCELG